MKRIIGRLVSVPMASTPLNHRERVILLTDVVLLTERSRRQQGMKELREILG